MNEKKYPIYTITSRWGKDFTATNIMFKHHLSVIEKKLLISDFEKGLRKKNSIEEDITTEVKFLEFESWCITWFNHYTYNSSLSDEELLISFEEFVRRKMPMQEALSRSFKDNNTDPHYCLMGAEDRWRWELCRCEKCQERGVVTIDH